MNKNTEKFATAYREKVLALNVAQDSALRWLLHEPVYDCSTDEFYLPCGNPAFDLKTFSHGCGWLKDDKTAGDWAASHAYGDIGATSLFIDENHITFLWYERPQLPGAKISRLVRTGASEWFVFWWYSGSRRSASDIDPPFMFTNITLGEWKARERSAASRGKSNRFWQAVAATCKHKSALIS